MDLLDEQRAQILESGGHLVFLGPGQHHQVHQAQIIVAPALAMGRHGSVQQAHDLFLGSVPDHRQNMTGSLHDGRDDQVPVLLDGGNDLRFQKAVAGLVGEVEVDDEGPRQDLRKLPAQRLDAGGVQQAFGPLGDGLAVGAALAFLLGDAGDAGQHEGGQILGHLLDLDVVEDDERVLRAIGVVRRVGGLLVLGLAVKQRRRDLAGGGLARSGRALEAGHGPRPGEVDQQETGEPGKDEKAIPLRTGHVAHQQIDQEPVRLFEVGVGQEFQRLHLARAVQDDAVLVAAVLHDLNFVRGDLGDLVLRIVQVEIDGVGSHIGMQPGEMVAHLATDHGQAG